jgi:hypothetical protein
MKIKNGITRSKNSKETKKGEEKAEIEKDFLLE